MAAEGDQHVTTDELPVRPRLAADVSVHAPRAEGDPWVIERDGRYYYRVTRHIAELAELLTGDYDHDELLAALGSAWDEPTLHQAIRKLQSQRLLDDGRRRSFSARRLAIVPPMSVQFAVLDPSGVLSRISAVIRLLSRRSSQLVCSVAAFGGLVALAVLAPDVREVLGNPVPGTAVLLLLAGGFLGTVIHELSHGATLMHFGGRPRRMGVMLFYVLPAFFCDVSDGWLLSERSQRVRVALAGVFAQFVIAGTAGIVAFAMPDSAIRDAVLLLSVATYLAGVINLVPFVKLDGYLALMTALDISNLRNIAMREARAFMGSVLYGARRSRELDRWWVVPYGLVCMAFPLYLVGGIAFALWSEMVRGMGFAGALLTFAFLAGLLYAVLRGAVRIVGDARAQGAGVPRILVVSVTVLAGLVGLLGTVQVEQNVPGYFRIADEGSELIVPTAAVGEIRAGDEVELRSNGTVFRVLVGGAEVASDDGQPRQLALEDVSPVRMIDTGTRLEFVAFPLDVYEQPELSQGVARVDVGAASLAEWLYARYVAPLTRL